ncbi:MAG: discoidin domain-containing protein, partial [Verrucomicrobiaceae bacterium]
MIGTTGFLRIACISALLVDVSMAEDTSWDSRLAETFSGRWKEIQKELSGLTPQLEKLPGIPIDDQGGTGGYACNHSLAEPAEKPGFAVEVKWPEAREIDLVALVPARRYDAKGLDAQYGLPEAFSVELIDAEGAVLRQVAVEPRTKDNPARRGHPFVYQVSPPVSAAGMRISALRLMPNTEEENTFIHAWAEAMAFAGNRNVALGAQVKNIGGTVPPTPWYWNNPFLVDGLTPLGLPEVFSGVHGNIGWMSEGRAKADETASLSVDLGAENGIDAVRLLPAKKPTSDLPSGFGFPRRFSVSVSPTAEAGSWTVVAERELPNPGHNPLLVTFPPVQARHVKVEATELWKAFADYPAFFALSEVEVLSGETNLAAGKGVQSPDGMMNLIAP